MAENFPNASHKSKNENVEQRNITPVFNEPPKLKKKSTGRKIAELFIPEDVDNIQSYLIGNVLVPAAKKTITDIVSTVLYGGKHGGGGGYSRTSYNRMYEEPHRSRTDYSARSSRRPRYDYRDVIIPNRAKVEDIFREMNQLIVDYRWCRVADLNQILGISSGGEYTANDYGWYSINGADCYEVEDGFLLDLPRPEPRR